jgi:hypothetical protein
MARSVAELLPGRFEDLTLDEVEGILAAHTGEERETLWLERKEQVTTSSLAKACSAFANTYGGLLVVGVRDKDDKLVGIKPLAAEAQLWVKDTLRAHVLPMPPFRARWLERHEDPRRVDRAYRGVRLNPAPAHADRRDLRAQPWLE